RILFDGFELMSSDQHCIFIRLEVRHSNDHRFRVKRSGDAADPFSEPPDEEVAWVFFAAATFYLFHVLLLLQMRITNQGHRMDTDVVIDDELKSGESYAIVRQRTDSKS